MNLPSATLDLAASTLGEFRVDESDKSTYLAPFEFPSCYKGSHVFLHIVSALVTYLYSSYSSVPVAYNV